MMIRVGTKLGATILVDYFEEGFCHQYVARLQRRLRTVAPWPVVAYY